MGINIENKWLYHERLSHKIMFYIKKFQEHDMEMFSLLWTQVKWVKNLLAFKQGGVF
jgi:hypothetical protein